jgi:transketolase
MTKKKLDPQNQRAILKDLELNAIAHRKKLVNLGRDLKIRLHYGACFSQVEILTTLYFYWMELDPRNPNWELRDRFILSKGHAAPSLYVSLFMRGYFPEKEFARFRRIGSPLQGHPDRIKTPGVECSSGSLGQGFPVACGMALASQINESPIKIYSLISDGECNEGSTWEAALIASNLGLDKIKLLVDWNRKSSYGEMEGRNDVEPLPLKWEAFGWHVFECDGHDFVSITSALEASEKVMGEPSVILCHTTKGKGIPYAEKNRTPSNFALTEQQYQEAFEYLTELEQELIRE